MPPTTFPLRRLLRLPALTLITSALLTACGGGSGDDTSSTPAPEPLRVLVPAYFYPKSGSGWEQLADSAKATPTVQITAIVNPSNGPGNKVDPQFTTALDNLTKAGGKAIGYVATNYGRAAPATVRAQIDRYLAFYGRSLISGFFLDEMSANAAGLGYYRDIQAYIKGLDGTLLVVGNPGTPPIADYAAVADVLVTFEGQAQAYGAFNPHLSAPWVYNYRNTKQAMLVHDASCSAMQAALQSAASTRNNTAWVYATNRHFDYASGSGNPWATLPSYWDSLLDTTDAINQGKALPGC